MHYVDCGVFYDGTTVFKQDVRLVVDDAGRVDTVGPIESVTPPAEATRHDHSDAVVIPGLVDAHLHLAGSRSMDPFARVSEYDRVALQTARATADLRKLLAAGFTTVRDVSSDAGLGLRDAVAEDIIPGPRIFTAGRGFSQTGGHGDLHYLPQQWLDTDDDQRVVDGPQECRKGVRRRIRQGADLIKIMTTGGVLSEKDEPHHSQFTDAEIQAFTQEAHRVGMPVASHAQGTPGIKSALRNGVDTIEHGIYLDDEAIELFHETDGVLVPTLAIVERIVAHGDDHGIPPWGMRKAREVREAHHEAVEAAYEAGVTIAAGTDFIGPDLVPHGENVMELELYVEEVGMDPVDALHTATGAAKHTLPDDDIGTLTSGDHADFVVLPEDPRADIGVLREIEQVYMGGTAVSVESTGAQ